MEKIKFEPYQLPGSFEWPERGLANRIPPRGMSDYTYGNGRAVYETKCGARLIYTKGGYRAQKGKFTTTLKPTGDEAIRVLENRLKVQE